MNARQLIDGLTHIAKDNGVNLENLQVNYRYDFDSDVVENASFLFSIGLSGKTDLHKVDFVFKDLFDEVNNNRLESVVLTTLDED